MANRVLLRECTGHSKHPLSNNTREDSTHGHHQMVNTEIRLIILFEVEDGDLLLLLLCHSFMSNSLQLHGLQHTRLLVPSPTPRICSSSCPLSW